jgi:hypothetical protein
MAYYVMYYRDRELTEPTGEHYALSDYDIAKLAAPIHDVAVVCNHTNHRVYFGYNGGWHDDPPGSGKLPDRVLSQTGNQQETDK